MFAWNKKRQLPVCRTVQRPRRDLLSAYAAPFQPRALCRAVGAHVKRLRHAVAPQIQRVVRMPGLGARRSGGLEVKTEYGLLDLYADYGFASSIYDDWFWKIFYEKGTKGNKFSIWISDFDVYEEQRHMGICS